MSTISGYPQLAALAKMAAEERKPTQEVMTCTVELEVTDTFGGEANYCWVKRKKVKVQSKTDRGLDLQAYKALRELAGWPALQGRALGPDRLR